MCYPIFKMGNVKCRTLYMYIQAGPDQIQTPAHWNLTGRSMTAPPPVLSPSSILPPPWSRCALIAARKKLEAPFKKCYYFNCFYFSKTAYIRNCVSRGVSGEFSVRYSAGQETLRILWNLKVSDILQKKKNPTICLYPKPDQSTPSHPKSNSTSIPPPEA